MFNPRRNTPPQPQQHRHPVGTVFQPSLRRWQALYKQQRAAQAAAQDGAGPAGSPVVFATGPGENER
jgi:hypothetical protein